MSVRKKDIAILLALLVVLVLCVRYFYKRIDDDRRVVGMDPYSLIVPDPKAVLSINRPRVLGEMILPLPSIGKLFAAHIPEALLPFLREKPEYASLLMASYAQGDVLYIPMEKEVASYLFKQLDAAYPFAPQSREEAPITLYYYPEVDNRFLGCYYYEGIFVASYNRKLLMETVERHPKNNPIPIPDLQKVISKSKSATINLFIPTETLDLHVSLNDTTEWSITDPWVGLDVFFSEGNICCYYEQPYEKMFDSIYPSIRDTITARIIRLIPTIQVSTQMSHDDNWVYYTVSGK